MPALIRLAPLLALAAACGGETPVQVQEAPSVQQSASPTEPAPPPQTPQLLELADGLVVEVLERGGGTQARRGGEVVVHYTARVEGTEAPFDSSWSRGVPDRWRLSESARPRLIQGLVRGLEGLPAGTRAVVRIPAALAYGAQGQASCGIPPDAALVYEVRLLEAHP